jgi:hypothetical protein
MSKLVFSAGALLLVAVVLGGCEKEQTVGLDESIPLPNDQAKTSVAYEDPNEKKGLDNLWPWNWFGPSEPKPITANDVLGDMSPELDSRAETHDEGRIRHARTIDTNTRSIWDDLDSMLLLNKPSRLSMFPTP